MEPQECLTNQQSDFPLDLTTSWRNADEFADALVVESDYYQSINSEENYEDYLKNNYPDDYDVLTNNTQIYTPTTNDEVHDSGDEKTYILEAISRNEFELELIRNVVEEGLQPSIFSSASFVGRYQKIAHQVGVSLDR